MSLAKLVQCKMFFEHLVSVVVEKTLRLVIGDQSKPPFVRKKAGFARKGGIWACFRVAGVVSL